MDITLRQEKPADYEAVFELIKTAFKPINASDQQEHILVEKLRRSQAFVPELSIVAENENGIIGHILLTEIQIVNGDASHTSLAMAPVSVKPAFQGKGIGGRLILESHRVAKMLGYASILVVGHEKYYPRFGYVPARNFNISLPFEVPDENCLVISLIENGLKGVCGKVVYAKEFFE
jgi:predicted N-acetyltransferase YhbS